MLVFIHELTPQLQVQALKEALRVARKLIIADSAVPLPGNINGFQILLAEFIFGRDHWPDFKSFLSVGGILGVLKESNLSYKIEHQSVFWNSSREIVLVERQ